MSVFIPIRKKVNAKECSNYRTIAITSHASKVMLEILQARLQKYVNHELPDVQAGFRKGRGTRDQIASIHCTIKKAKEFQKSIYFCIIDYNKAFVQITKTVENSSRDGNTRPPDLPPEKSVCRSRSNSQNQTWINRSFPGGYDSTLSLLRARVQTMVRELRSHKLPKNINKQSETMTDFFFSLVELCLKS